MRPFAGFLLITFLVLTITGCEKYKEKNFSTTIEVRFPVDVVSENNGAVTIDLNQIADVLATNADLSKVKDQIKRYKLVGIKYKVFEYWNSENTTFTGSIGFGNKNMTDPGMESVISSLSLQESMNATELTKLEFDDNSLEKIQQYFTDTDALKIFLRGELSETPAKFTLYLQVDVDAVAEVKK